MNTKVIEKGMDTISDVHYSGTEEGGIISGRHTTDMSSDNWLSKSIRPLLLITFVVLYIFFSFMSANGVEINGTLISILKTWGDLGVMFYFGSRGIEKVAKTVRQSSIQERRDERQDARIERKKARIIRRQK